MCAAHRGRVYNFALTLPLHGDMLPLTHGPAGPTISGVKSDILLTPQFRIVLVISSSRTERERCVQSSAYFCFSDLRPSQVVRLRITHSRTPFEHLLARASRWHIKMAYPTPLLLRRAPKLSRHLPRSEHRHPSSLPPCQTDPADWPASRRECRWVPGRCRWGERPA